MEAVSSGVHVQIGFASIVAAAGGCHVAQWFAADGQSAKQKEAAGCVGWATGLALYCYMYCACCSAHMLCWHSLVLPWCLNWLQGVEPAVRTYNTLVGAAQLMM
jgi:hypothetical protein